MKVIVLLTIKQIERINYFYIYNLFFVLQNFLFNFFYFLIAHNFIFNIFNNESNKIKY